VQTVSVLGAYLRSMPFEVISASVIICITTLFLPFAMNRIYDRVVPQQALGTLAMLTLLLLGCMIVEVTLRIARSYLLARIAVHGAWRQMRFSLEELASSPVADLVGGGRQVWYRRLQALAQASEQAASPNRLIVIDALFVPVFMTLLVLTGGIIALAPAATCLVTIGLIVSGGRAIRTCVAGRQEADGELQRFTMESLSAIATVKTLGLRHLVEHRYSLLQNACASHQKEIMRASEQTQGLTQSVITAAQIVTMFAGALMAIDGLMTPGMMMCSSILAVRMVSPIARLAMAWQDVQSELAIASLQAPRAPALPRAGKDVELATFTQPPEVALAGVSAHYLNTGVLALDGVDLVVGAGELIAITGPDAVATELLLRLIVGDVDPLAGTVTADGRALSGFDRSARGSHVFMPALPRLVRGTILSNITLHRPWVGADRAHLAAQLVGLEHDVRGLQFGFETQITDAPQSELSAALCKRIGLARSLAATPYLLSIAEPQAGIDLYGQKQIETVFRQLHGKVTMVISTTSPRLMLSADRVFELRGGRLHALQLTGRSTTTAAQGVA
jgi:ABC-type protease/lipase transport system fused ATPase/permease subunit